MGAERFQQNMEKGLIEVAPLAYMRGRTLDDSFIILDEAQNTSREQMKMFLTRIGFGSHVVITGDVTQIDLPADKVSGLKELSQSFVKGDKLILMGCSQGGFVSAMTAARLPEKVEKLVLFYPALCIPDDARAGKMMFFRFDAQNIPDILGKRPMELGGDYARSVVDKNPYALIAGYPGQVLIVHGTADKIVAPRYSEKARETYGYDRCTLVTIEGAGHGFKKEADRKAIAYLREFVQGRVELFAVDVKLTGRSMTRKGGETELILPFTGTADGAAFHGVIDPGAKDVQHWRGMKARHCLADYTITGADFTGDKCTVHIVNEDTGKGWTPTVTTDSTALGYINEEPCTKFFEPRKGGPVIHIFNRPATAEK